MIKGKVIAGEFGKIIARQKSDSPLELGELLVAASSVPGEMVLLQVFDLLYGSQVSQQNLELIAGMNLEEGTATTFMDHELRHYHLALLKTLISFQGKKAKVCKSLPAFFSDIREVQKQDLQFLTTPQNPLFLGKLRSGSRELDVDIFLPGVDVLSHHILIPATTGRGKSNLTSVMLWDCVGKGFCGMLVLDPHDEYFGRTGLGLKDHPAQDKVVYYSKNPPPGQLTLKINLTSITPSHFSGVVNFSDPQRQAMRAYYKRYGKEWIEAIILDKPLEPIRFEEATLAVVKRQLMGLLDLEWDTRLHCGGVFDLQAGETTILDICHHLEQGKTVIIDTSVFSGSVELLIGGMVSEQVFKMYKKYKISGQLFQKPVISIVLEEAPRVLGKEVLEQGTNIFETIAREGRKFKVGLVAITQLPSLIPREILANMNTKIILGIEMAPERTAVIESASQDLSSDHRTIAALDKGEAIVTSNFARFATPIKIPLFEDFVKNYLEKNSTRKATQGFGGVKLN